VPQVRPAAPERTKQTPEGGKPGTQAETRRKYALTALHGLADELSSTPEGGRNNKLNALSFRAGRLIGGGHLERGEVEAELTRAAQTAGLSESEITQTLSTGLSAGMTDPETLVGVGNATGKRKKSGEGDTEEDENSGGKRTPAGTRALEYAQEAGAELWHDQSGNAYMTATANGHREHYRLPSRAVRDYLQALYWGKEKRALNGQGQAEALGLMEALARREGQEHLTAVRVAHVEGQTYLDLGSDTWEAIEVGRGYWKVIRPSECPVRFTRPRGFLALPSPVEGGSLSELREFVSTDDRGFMMCVSWLLGGGVRPESVSRAGPEWRAGIGQEYWGKQRQEPHRPQ